MRQKSMKPLNHTLLMIHTALKQRLMRDFSAPLASRIIEHNVRKYHLEARNRQEYMNLINAIASDYQAIQPLGHVNIDDLKKELQDAVRQIKN